MALIGAAMFSGWTLMFSGPRAEADAMTEDEIRADARRRVAEDIEAGRIPPEPSAEAQDRLNRVLAAPEPSRKNKPGGPQAA
jgi:hypothetical protein